MQVDPINPTLKAPGAKHLKPIYLELLLSSAFKFNLRRYTEDKARAGAVGVPPPVGHLGWWTDAESHVNPYKVGPGRRCNIWFRD